jgi:hypothetical protein
MKGVAAFGLGLTQARSAGPAPRPAPQGHHVEVSVEAPRVPAGELAEGEAVPQDQPRRPHEALVARPQKAPLDGPAGGVRPVEHPERLAGAGAVLHRPERGGHEGVDAGSDVLQIDEEDVEGVEHLLGQPACIAVEAPDPKAPLGVLDMVRLDHVVLSIRQEAVLGPEGAGRPHARRRQRVEGVGEIGGHGGRVREDGDPAVSQARQAIGIAEEGFEAELHAADPTRASRGSGPGLKRSPDPSLGDSRHPISGTFSQRTIALAIRREITTAAMDARLAHAL